MNIKNLSLEEYLLIGSAVQSAKIKKGHFLAKTAADALRETGYNIEEEVKIEFPEDPTYSQKSYKVDIWMETEDEVLLIDSKSPSWNNNTPMSDTVEKYVRAKKVISETTTKTVRFLLLKNYGDTEKDLKDLERRSIAAAPYGIEIVKSNDWLSDKTNKNINLDNLTDGYLFKTILSNIESTI